MAAESGRIPSDPLPGPDPPRKLTRSTSDKYVWGVAGGLGRQFGVDPMLFRVAFMVSVVFGGIGIAAYLALGAFLPRDDGEPAWIADKSRATTIAVVVALCDRGRLGAQAARLPARPGPDRRRRLHRARRRPLPRVRRPRGRGPGADRSRG